VSSWQHKVDTNRAFSLTPLSVLPDDDEDKCLKHILCQVSQTHTMSSVSSTYRIVSQAHTILPATMTIYIAHYVTIYIAHDLAVGQDQLYRTLSLPHTVSTSAKTSRSTHYAYHTLSLPRFTTHTHTRLLSFSCVS